MEQLITGLKDSPVLLEALIKEISDERLDKEFKTADWSILDHVRHLLETQSVFMERLNLFKNEEKPVISGYSPDEEIRISYENGDPRSEIYALISEFSQIRLREIDLIKIMNSHMRGRQARHSEHAYPLSFNRLLLHFLSHDHYHIYRIEELGFFKEDKIESW